MGGNAVKPKRGDKQDRGNGKARTALVAKTKEIVPELVQEGKKKGSNQPKRHAPKTRVMAFMRRAKILDAAISGKDMKKVAIETGLSPKSASSQVSGILKEPEVQRAFSLIMEEAGLSDEVLAGKVRELLNAKETRFFQWNGKVTDKRIVPALETQRKTLELATKLKGHLRDQTQVDVNIGLMALVVAAMRSEVDGG